MTWKKGQYLITVKDGEEIVRTYVNGITSQIEDLKIGIHKSDSNDWLISDIATGYKIKIAPTQKFAKEWVESNAGVIYEIINTPKHKEIIEEVSKCKIRL